MLYWQLLKTLEIHELFAFMLEIIIIVLDTEANTRLLILGLPVFCKFNFIFFEDHSNMLKKKNTFFPHVNILLLLKNTFSSIVLNFFPTHTKKLTKMYTQQCHFVTLEISYVLCFCLIVVLSDEIEDQTHLETTAFPFKNQKNIF